MSWANIFSQVDVLIGIFEVKEKYWVLYLLTNLLIRLSEWVGFGGKYGGGKVTGKVKVVWAF